MNNNITIAIPSYKRPYLLNRALTSAISNDDEIEILVAVNGEDEFFGEYKKIENKYKNFKNISFFFHKKNIGALDNIFFLINKCKTNFITLLADDDETNTAGLIKLKNFLLKNKDYESGCLYWEFIHSDGIRNLLKPQTFEQNSLLKRVLNYFFSSDDAFFYGLHRTFALKQCSFEGYWKPNHNELANWAYVFQIDLILQGKIFLLEEKNYKWINHDYTEKHYFKKKKNFFTRVFKYFIRRLNIYYLYLYKILAKRHYYILIIAFFLIPFLLLRDIFFREPIYHKVKHKNKTD